MIMLKAGTGQERFYWLVVRAFYEFALMYVKWIKLT